MYTVIEKKTEELKVGDIIWRARWKDVVDSEHLQRLQHRLPASYLVKVSNTEEAIERLEEVWGDDKDGKYAAHYKRITELFNHLPKRETSPDELKKDEALRLVLPFLKHSFKEVEEGAELADTDDLTERFRKEELKIQKLIKAVESALNT